MPTSVINEILSFCPQGTIASGDIMALEDYKNDVQRLRGHQPGIARRELENMALRQSSFVAAGLAQFVAKRYAPGVRDDADLDALETAITAAITALIAAGNAQTATRLATKRTIGGVAFDGSANIHHYATCSTAAATAAKTVALSGFALATGARVLVKFTVTNSAANPTLDVNGTGAKPIQYRGAQLLGFDTKVVGCTNDYEKTANSDVVVITSGIPRKPGMTREELIGVNAGIVKSVAENILKYSPNAILVVISNPMDTMTYLSLKALGLPKNRIIGMGGALDSSRFKYFLSQALGCNANEVEGMVIGGHGDTTMIPLTRFATYKGMPVSNFLSEEKLQEVAAATMVGGATLTKLLGTSAWYAPGAAGAFVVESIIHNQGKMVPCSVYLEGEYGESDICCGVPVILGKNGIEKIVELPLNEEEKAKFAASAAAVRKTNAALHEVGAL